MKKKSFKFTSVYTLTTKKMSNKENQKVKINEIENCYLVKENCVSISR